MKNSISADALFQFPLRFRIFLVFDISALCTK